ncbi:MAG: AbrB/MazE/SpoVT family DNA-binding domain-containing protein [Clostridia bacterium]|nr:AbrB/MazE/SpoVT family DNA-binding domain-containing protein [Clostridia bacterium]
MDGYIVRRIDELGRIVLPKEWRDINNIREKDALELHIDGKSLTLKKHNNSCVFCGNKKSLQMHNNIHVCKKCINVLILTQKGSNTKEK